MTDDLRLRTVLPSVIEAIGSTPAIDLARLTRGLDGRIVAKLEYLNPGFSKKDRIARQIVLDARESGALRPGQPVVELTSGNTGTGLAIVCTVLGHSFVAVMSEGNSRERVRMMTALGAEVVLVPQAPGSVVGQVSGADLALVEVRAQELTRERAAFRADQFGNPSAALAHERYTAAELWAQAGGNIDAFVEYVGTAGTYAGVTRALKARNPAVACYVLEPEVLLPRPASPSHPGHGSGWRLRHAHLPRSDVPVDGYLTVTDDEAILVARRLAWEEGVRGVLLGRGRCVRLLREFRRCARADRGSPARRFRPKYLSTDLWGA
jgi:cysteine synthase A